MAMIKCSECGREISDRAKVCPGCGATTLAGRNAEEQKKQDIIQSIKGLICLGFFIAGGVLLFLGLKDYISDVNNGYYTYKAPFTDHEKEVIEKIILGVSFIGACIVDLIWLRRNTLYYEAEETEWVPPNLSALREEGSSAMWLCPDCNAKNKASSYTCNRCGYNRIKVREDK